MPICCVYMSNIHLHPSNLYLSPQYTDPALTKHWLYAYHTYPPDADARAVLIERLNYREKVNAAVNGRSSVEVYRVWIRMRVSVIPPINHTIHVVNLFL